MKLCQGFSFTEVLVALFLTTSMTLLLFKQQWSVARLVNQMQSRAQTLIETDNLQEQVMS